MEAVAREWSLPGSELRQILLIIEELFSNVTRYAYQDVKNRMEHQVGIRLWMSDNSVTLEMVDDGIPFNPMDYNPGFQPDPASLDEGGMGLTLIKAFADSINYQREAHENRLVIRKDIKSINGSN